MAAVSARQRIIVALLAAALGAGLPPERIHLFSLDGAALSGSPVDWLTLPTAPAEPPPDSLTGPLRSLASGVDALFQ